MFLRQFVRNGAIWLDKYDPTWFRRISADELENTDRDCVIGQLYGDAMEFVEQRYFIRGWLTSHDHDDARWSSLPRIPLMVVGMWFMIKKGFIPTHDPEVVWKNLWAAEVRKRQATPAAREILSDKRWLAKIERGLDESNAGKVRSVEASRG